MSGLKVFSLLVGAFILGLLLALVAYTDIEQDVAGMVQTVLAPESEDTVALGTEAPTVVSGNTSMSTPTSMPTLTSTSMPTVIPTVIPPQIILSLEGGEIFLEVEHALEEAIASYNEENDTDWEFKSIIFDLEDLEQGAVVIELLDNETILGYIPDTAEGWCMLDECDNAASLLIVDYALFDPDDIEFTMSVSAPSSRLGYSRALVYLDRPTTKCAIWFASGYPETIDSPFERFFFVDVDFTEALFAIDLRLDPIGFQDCPYDE